MKKGIILILLLTLQAVFAADYYADVKITVDAEGLVGITGLTNHPLLNTAGSTAFTSFENNYWLLNISLPDTFSNYVYEIILPKEAIINYLNTPKVMSISQDNNNLIITAIGGGEPFKAVVQYRIKETPNYPYLFWLLIIPPLIIIFIFLNMKKEQGKKIDYSLLTDRQAEIMRLVEKKRRVTQKQLENILQLPKSALSRNIESLIKKDLLIKERKGVTNVLILKK